MAELLRRERERRNHSQAAVAEKVGMDQRTLSKWESGDTPQQIEWIKGLASYYGVSVGYLVGETAAPLEAQAAAALVAGLPATQRAAAVAVLKAAITLAQTQVNELEGDGAAASGGGVTLPSVEHTPAQTDLATEKAAMLALLRKMLTPVEYDVVLGAVNAGRLLTDAELARLVESSGKQHSGQVAKLVNDKTVRNG